MTTAALDTALWALGRGTGVVALLMFTVSLVLGVFTRSGRPLPGLGRFAASDLHRTAALTGTLLVGVHVMSLFFDSYAQLRLVDLVIPFLGAAKPLWLGLGTLAVDLLAVITVVSLLRHRVGPRVFKAVHFGTYLLWPIALVHAIGTGTDALTPWLLGLAAACTAAVVGAVGWRLTPSFIERGWSRSSRVLPHQRSN
ncbi:MAG: ferric reductase-like transmembrane domain-containing protein [Nocardioides sp.]